MKRSDEPAKRAITAINLEIDRRASVGANSELSDFQSAVRTALGERWKWFVFQGIVMLALGCLAVVEPVIASVAAGIYIGWLFLFSGLLGLVTMFSARDASAFFWILLTSALSLAVGILLIWKPDEGTVSLTLVLTAFFIAEGAFQVGTSISYRDVLPGSWGSLLASGITDLVLAGLIIYFWGRIIYFWPQSASWTLGLIVGTNLISTGLAILMTAIELRNVGKSG
jgi:uncharacterized membrane protein HdeD (DUF308 family)